MGDMSADSGATVRPMTKAEVAKMLRGGRTLRMGPDAKMLSADVADPDAVALEVPDGKLS